MSFHGPDLDDVLTRAKSGKEVTVGECLYLKRNLDPTHTFPTRCNQLIQAASKSGLLPRRNSRVAQAWDISEGHGSRFLKATEHVAGGSFDNPAEDSATPLADIYLKAHTPAQQEKIRRLHIRTASRGAKPRVDYESFVASPENQQAVARETARELVRRQSRREEIRKMPVH